MNAIKARDEPKPRTRTSITSEELTAFSREIGMETDAVETQLPVQSALHRGSLIQTGLGKGLSLHTIDVTHLRDFIVEMRVPASMSFSFVVGGSVSMSIGTDEMVLGPDRDGSKGATGGYFATAEPRSFRRSAERGGRLRAAVVIVTPDWFEGRGAEQWSGATILSGNESMLGTWTLSPREILLAEELLQPAQYEPFLENLRLESRAIEALSCGMRALGKLRPSVVPSLRRSHRERLDAIKAFVESDEAADVSLENMARRFGIDEKLLQRDFRAAFGTTIFNYVRDFRLSKAREALLYDGVSIAQAAHRAGYANAANFATAFRKRFGMTPRDVRLG